jgi:hypothetical protein
VGCCDNGSELSVAGHREYFEKGAFPKNYSLEIQGADYPATYIKEKFGLAGPAYVFATAFTGKLRVFTLVGMAGGFVLEHFSVGNLAMFLLSKAVKTLKGWVLMPLKKFIHKIGQKIKASFVKSHINLLKNKKNLQSP